MFTSGRWPVPYQMSLVMRISPGSSVSGGNALKKWRTVIGKVPINEAMLAEDCTREWP